MYEEYARQWLSTAGKGASIRKVKLTFDDCMEAMANDLRFSRDDAQAAALRRTIWVAMNSSPGCLPDSWSACRTKEAAIQTCAAIAGDECRPSSALRKYGIWRDPQGYVYEVTKQTLADCL